MNYKIMIIEDDPDIAGLLSLHLQKFGFSVHMCRDFSNVLKEFERIAPHLVLLDINLPAYDGFYWCGKLRAKSPCPILFLSALGENQDVIAALRAGGDDYLPKPYDIGVLIARVEARLRAGRREKRFFHFGALRLDTAARIGYCGAQELTLTQKEFSLLLQLAQSGGQIIAKEDLYERVWGRSLAGDSTALYTAVSRLNTKLTESGAQVTIRFLRGKGYTLEAV